MKTSKSARKNLITNVCVIGAIAIMLLGSGIAERINPVNDFVIVRQMETATMTPTPAYEEDGRLNINTASKEELMELPGIGEALSQRIVDYREEYGAFEVIEDLLRVSGIGEKKFEALSDLITVGE